MLDANKPVAPLIALIVRSPEEHVFFCVFINSIFSVISDTLLHLYTRLLSLCKFTMWEKQNEMKDILN